MTRPRWLPTICATHPGISRELFSISGSHAGMKQPPTPFCLRQLEPADVPAVLVIEKLSFPTPRNKAIYLYELAHNKLAHYQALTRLEASGKETLLGYTGCWTIADEIHISTIAVDPRLRGQGFGQLLLLSVLFMGLESTAALVTLEVRESNHAAQKLYKKYRFSEVGERPGYYRDTGEDAILMTVNLDSPADYRTFLEQEQDALYARLALIAS